MVDAHDAACARLRAERARLRAQLERQGVVLADLPDLRAATVQARREAWRAVLARRQAQAERQREEAS